MECAHTGTDSKYTFAITGTGTMEFAYTGTEPKCKKCKYQYGHHVGMPVPVMEHAHTGTEPMYNANTGIGTFVECQYQ
jgi:hypothetical protein